MAQSKFGAHNLSGCNNFTTEFEYIHMIRNYDQSNLWGHIFYLTYSPWLFIGRFRQKSRQSPKNGNHVVYTLLIGRILMPLIHRLFEIVEVLPIRENQKWIMQLVIVCELVYKIFIIQIVKKILRLQFWYCSYKLAH